HRFTANRLVERRGRLVYERIVLEILAGWMSSRATDLVTNTIHDRLSEIGLQSPFMLGLERLETTQRLEDGFLYQIVGVEHVPREPRKTSARPPPQRRQVARKQCVHRGTTPGLGELQELERRGRVDSPVSERQILGRSPAVFHRGDLGPAARGRANHSRSRP